MARPLRIQFASGLYHVTSRGNRKDSIFVNDRDYRAFSDILGHIVPRCGGMCHA